MGCGVREGEGVGCGVRVRVGVVKGEPSPTHATPQNRANVCASRHDVVSRQKSMSSVGHHKRRGSIPPVTFPFFLIAVPPISSLIQSVILGGTSSPSPHFVFNTTCDFWGQRNNAKSCHANLLETLFVFVV